MTCFECVQKIPRQLGVEKPGEKEKRVMQFSSQPCHVANVCEGTLT